MVASELDFLAFQISHRVARGLLSCAKVDDHLEAL